MQKNFPAALILAGVFAAGFFLAQNHAQAEHEHSGSSAKPKMTYTCTPDAFSLTQSGNSYTLTASLEMPTPAYGYEIAAVETRNGRIKAVLKLSGGRDSMIIAPQVISNVDLSHTFEHTGMLHALSVAVEKDFNWGPDAINCTHQ
jgi:hypothetical protein